jgi:hypothetical protein
VKADVAAEALAQGFITQAEADLMQQAALRQGGRGGMRGSGLGTGVGTGAYCGDFVPAN